MWPRSGLGCKGAAPADVTSPSSINPIPASNDFWRSMLGVVRAGVRVEVWVPPTKPHGTALNYAYCSNNTRKSIRSIGENAVPYVADAASAAVTGSASVDFDVDVDAGMTHLGTRPPKEQGQGREWASTQTTSWRQIRWRQLCCFKQWSFTWAPFAYCRVNKLPVILLFFPMAYVRVNF